MVEGVPIPYRANGEPATFTVHLIDFENPQSNDFKVINQYTIIEYKNKRPDILVFINGIPMALFELKNMVHANTTIEDAYKQIKNYQLDIPSLFYYNAFNAISDGKLDRKTGEWKYGMAKYMRNSLPNATFIGFTGTPIDFDDKSKVEVLGDYIDIYDMTQAVEDGATVPIYYETVLRSSG